MKYLKYYISTLTLIIAFHVCFLGEFYPTIFFFCFSSFIIIGDLIIKEDTKEQNYTKLFLLDLPMYLNFPILTIILILATFFLSDAPSNVFTNVISSYLSIDLVEARNSMNFFDSIFLVIQMGLFIGIMGTVPGHELVHRKKNKLDLSMGNWLLALSWDCAFAVEHVHGHHKNVGLSIDPATAKRGENIYKFIINATLKEHKDAWKIELGRLKKRGISFYSMKNKMILGYIRSAIIMFASFLVGGLKGMLFCLLCSLIAKALLEVINFSEHYGLVRVKGEPVMPRHSWNSNSTLSSTYLYNVTRHSSHHERANLKYWELRSYQNAPMMPQGYLTMLYTALFLPGYFHTMMAKKLLDWDRNFASDQERILADKQNKQSGIPALVNSISFQS